MSGRRVAVGNEPHEAILRRIGFDSMNSSDREISPPGFDTFKYPTAVIRVVFIGLPVLILLGALMLVDSPSNSWRHPAIDEIFGGVVLVGYLLIYIHIRSFFVRLEPNAIAWGSIFYKKAIALSSIKRFAIIEGGRGGQTLELQNAKKIVKF